MRTKKGISLIVLVITIIVMIIIAAAIIIALDNSNVINRANEAVDSTNIKEVQYMASLIWAEAYLDEDMKKEDITKEYIIGKLQDEGIDTTGYDIIIESNGVGVKKKEPALTLGSLITGPSDYGKIVDYSANNVNRWQVYYETDEYVFLIAENVIGEAISCYNLATSDVTTPINNTYNIFKLADDTYTGFVLTDSYINNKYVANLIANYDSYANREDYGADYVVGAIGGPTIELLAAGYNAYHNSPNAITTSFASDGYIRPEDLYPADEIYLKPGVPYYLASPGNYDGGFDPTQRPFLLLASDAWSLGESETGIMDGSMSDTAYIRPVVCLSSNIPAVAGTGDIAFSLIKSK